MLCVNRLIRLIARHWENDDNDKQNNKQTNSKQSDFDRMFEQFNSHFPG